MRRRRFLWLVVVLGGALLLSRQSGWWLISAETEPAHADAAIVLQGSILGERARLAGAMRLLQDGTVNRVLLSVPKESYWGEATAPAARGYIEKVFGSDAAQRLDFCETGPAVNSTEEEAGVLAECVRAQGWQSIRVVTSDYHTRRAGMIWRKTVHAAGLPVKMTIHGVDDPEYRAAGWWRERRYAKTWFLEFTKLVWTGLNG